MILYFPTSAGTTRRGMLYFGWYGALPSSPVLFPLSSFQSILFFKSGRQPPTAELRFTIILYQDAYCQLLFGDNYSADLIDLYIDVLAAPQLFL